MKRAEELPEPTNIMLMNMNIDKTAKCKSKPQPRNSTAMNHKRSFNTRLSTNHTNKPKIGNTIKNNMAQANYTESHETTG